MESDEGSEVRRAIDSLESLVAAGAKVPLIDQVRIGATDLRRAIEGLQQARALEGGRVRP